MFQMLETLSSSMGWKERWQLSHVEDQVQCIFDHVGIHRLLHAGVCKWASSKRERHIWLDFQQRKELSERSKEEQEDDDAICTLLVQSCSIKQAQSCDKSQ